LEWLEDMGSDYSDDTTDMRDRSGVEVRTPPRVERIPVRKGKPHIPGSHWASSSCLCTCHYVKVADCDETSCKAWRKQNAKHAQRAEARKQARWQRKHSA
jgi:hypothetical protein